MLKTLLLTLDPSSSCIGYAVAQAGKELPILDCGKIRPNRQKDKSIDRTAVKGYLDGTVAQKPYVYQTNAK